MLGPVPKRHKRYNSDSWWEMDGFIKFVTETTELSWKVIDGVVLDTAAKVNIHSI